MVYEFKLGYAAYILYCTILFAGATVPALCVTGISVSLTMFGARLPLPVACGTEPVNVCGFLVVEWVEKTASYT
jgi:hypothetical protein